MVAGAIEWVIIRDVANREIGAIGFLDGTAVVIAAFYDDRDGNKDGRVSWGEAIAAKLSPVSLKGSAVTEVAMAARLDPDVLARDSGFATEAMRMYLHFAAGLVADGIYAAYFSRGVRAVATPIAGRLASDTVRQFVIRKGMEKAVKSLYDGTVRP